MSEAPSLLVDRPADGVLLLSMNRHQRRNAIDAAMVAALREALRCQPARVVVLTSASPGIFCAGADLKVAAQERAQVSRDLYELYAEIVALPSPVIAALRGPAVGGGAQLAIAADLRVGEGSASLRIVGPGHGLAVGGWGLPSLVGRGRAIELCLTGREITASEALEAGLIDRLGDDALADALALAEQIAALDRDAVARVKAIVARASAVDDALACEARLNASWAGEARPHIAQRR